MARHYSITYSCGHATNHVSLGAHHVRALDKDYDVPCRECSKPLRDAEFQAGHPDLAALTGSPKQVAWAESIRRETMNHLEDYFERFGSSIGLPEADRAIVCAWLETQSSASWWIQQKTDKTDVSSLCRIALAASRS